VGAGTVRREDVIVATKGGFIPFDGGVPPDPHRYLTETYVRRGILEPQDVVGGLPLHDAALPAGPDRPESREPRSRDDRRHYIHNPETQLGEVDRAEFDARMRAAFATLEEAVAEGKLRQYGTATWNGYRQPAAAPDQLELGELVQAAREVAGADHHFKVIQLPYNLAMPEAFTRANQRVGADTLPCFQAAERPRSLRDGVGSIYQGQLAPEPAAPHRDFLPGLRTDAQRALQFVRSTPGIGTALVGMKSVAHVRENLELIATPAVPWEAVPAPVQRGLTDRGARRRGHPMELIGCADAAELARRAADAVVERVRAEPALAIAMPAGRTPRGMYAALRERHRRGGVDFARMRVFAVDELCPPAPADGTSGGSSRWSSCRGPRSRPRSAPGSESRRRTSRRCARSTSGPSPAPGGSTW